MKRGVTDNSEGGNIEVESSIVSLVPDKKNKTEEQDTGHSYMTYMCSHLLIIIFGHLPVFYLLRCREVCKRWSDLVVQNTDNSNRLLWGDTSYFLFKDTWQKVEKDAFKSRTHHGSICEIMTSGSILEKQYAFSAYGLRCVRKGWWKALHFLNFIRRSRIEYMIRFLNERFKAKAPKCITDRLDITNDPSPVVTFTIANMHGLMDGYANTVNNQLILWILAECGGFYVLDLLRHDVNIPFDYLFESILVKRSVTVENIRECFVHETLFTLMIEGFSSFGDTLRLVIDKKSQAIEASEWIFELFRGKHVTMEEVLKWNYDKTYRIFLHRRVKEYYFNGKLTGDNNPDNLLAEYPNAWKGYDSVIFLEFVLNYGLYTLKEVLSMNIPPEYIHAIRDHEDLLLDLGDEKTLTLEDLKKFPTVRHLDYFLTREVQEYYRTGVMTLEYICSLTEYAIRRKGKTALRQYDVAKKKLWGRKLRK